MIREIRTPIHKLLVGVIENDGADGKVVLVIKSRNKYDRITLESLSEIISAFKKESE